MDYDELKKLNGFTSLHQDCSVERFDGIDLDAVLEPRLKSDYLKWLDGADIDLLERVDVAGELTVEHHGDFMVARLPDEYRRLLYIRLRGWKRAADIVAADSGDRRLDMIGNEFAQPGPEHPLAVCRGREYELWPAVSDHNPVAEAIAVKI